jgi:hypothetical protein
VGVKLPKDEVKEEPLHAQPAEARLPFELRALIVAHLSLDDRVCVAQVSHAWRLAANDPQVWRKAFLSLCAATGTTVAKAFTVADGQDALKAAGLGGFVTWRDLYLAKAKQKCVTCRVSVSSGYHVCSSLASVGMCQNWYEFYGCHFPTVASKGLRFVP